ncbi:MAG: hypothetical protein QOJ16_2394, partial [Acidobacteriota bacterium]|nr:hypothetical protein [Acidobacteriota bacterium]
MTELSPTAKAQILLNLWSDSRSVKARAV